MKRIVKLLSLLVAAVLCLTALAGCSQPAAQDASTPAGQNNSAPSNDSKLTVGVIQLVEHKALDSSYQGFVDALADNGFVDGDKIEILFENAQGDLNNLSTISDRYVSRNVDLILAIATPAAQAIAGKTTQIPILATAVTSYVGAELIESDDAPGGNVSGTSDMNPVAAQVDLIRELVPDVETIGLIYNSSEYNSTLQVNLAKARIEAVGLAWHEVTITGANDVLQAMQSLVTKCEAVYIPTDNTLASSMAAVHTVASEAKIPTICGETNMVLEGGLATMGIDYYDLGYKTGLMAVDVLNGADPGTMPIQYADRSNEVVINGTVAEEIGCPIPDKYKDSVVTP